MAVSASASLPATPPAKPVIAASQIVDSRPAVPSAPSNPSPQDDSMTAPSGEGSSELKRPHEAASPDNDTPSKKTLSDAPATPASDSSAVRTERARLTALAQEIQIKTAVATTRQAEAVRIMQETLQDGGRRHSSTIRRGRNLYIQQRSVLTPLIQDIEHVAVTEGKEKEAGLRPVLCPLISPCG